MISARNSINVFVKLFDGTMLQFTIQITKQNGFMSQNLKELESDELITRTVYPQIPPKVEYNLTDRGNSLVKILDKLCDWGIENRK